MTGLGLYVHIPFCAKKCSYCDFPSRAGQMHLRAPYVDKLTDEIVRRAELAGHLEADSVYIGGGTPSLMTPAQMTRVLDTLKEQFRLGAACEISCEANPGALSGSFLSALRAGGVNRLSLGAQSADEGLLKLLGRQHSWAQAVSAAEKARALGFDNINIDLMMGIPGQTAAMWEETLDSALKLKPEHLSCYGLIVEDGTPLANRVEDGSLSLPDEEAERDMYELTLKKLAAAGYHQYEISNFAKPGYECRHNTACWQRKDYLGFGSAAHSLEGGSLRRANPADIGDYLQGMPPDIQLIGPEDRMFESLMLGLRMTRGLDLEAFELAHGVAFREAFAEQAKPSLSKGLTEFEGSKFFRLTRQGMDLMNQVLLDFMR